MIPARLLDLGRTAYAEAHARQLALVGERQRGDGVDTLFLVEHEPVITVGRRPGARAHLHHPGAVPVVEVERGGDVTYHGPGQLVAYPVLRLGEGERDLHRYLRNLEEAVLRAVVDLGVQGAERRAGATGVWVGARKLASIGVACRRWVSFHGLAVNVADDLGGFAGIEPCGFDPAVMTSLSELLGRPVAPGELKAPLVHHLGAVLGRAFAT